MRTKIAPAGPQSSTFSLEPGAISVASREVMAQWIKDGRDPTKVPKGYERVKSEGLFKEGRPEYDECVRS